MSPSIPRQCGPFNNSEKLLPAEQAQRFLIHDRDSIYSSDFDSALKAMGLRILKTPFQAPQANAFCERLVGTVRRECLDFLIPLNERHVEQLGVTLVKLDVILRRRASLKPDCLADDECYGLGFGLAAAL